MGESPKGKSPSKAADAKTSGESKEANIRKCLYIVVITIGAPRENLPSEGTMKKKIVEMLVVHKKEGGIPTKTLDRPILGF